jgi:hypothetical protein
MEVVDSSEEEIEGEDKEGMEEDNSKQEWLPSLFYYWNLIILLHIDST